jgi:hypothetical protein
MQVRLGGHEKEGGRYEARQGVWTLVHEKYNATTFDEDIALILLDKPATKKPIKMCPSKWCWQMLQLAVQSLEAAAAVAASVAASAAASGGAAAMVPSLTSHTLPTLRPHSAHTVPPPAATSRHMCYIIVCLWSITEPSQTLESQGKLTGKPGLCEWQG